eukprot:UN21538
MLYPFYSSSDKTVFISSFVNFHIIVNCFLFFIFV